MRPASVRKLHHWLASWVNTDALHCLGDAADSQKRTFMVRVQNQPVNPGVRVATLGMCSPPHVWAQGLSSTFFAARK
ncbi:hypothetical protein BSU04_28575 [Caballeronia sordidicola]|uniref:Uncharacterized protein n=1 Tax=Caballeronia sordidicola TaxID=196367 RepID=A0A226WV95_CABSO|nr:hypothetical protein BSU04_28575 [Caballeronia sordidicola]